MTNSVFISYGSCSFDSCSARITVFAMTADGTNARQNPSQRLVEIKGTKSSSLASNDGYADYGAWYNNSLYAHDGVVLCIQSSVSVQRRIRNEGVIFLCLREGGPLQKIETLMPRHRLMAVDRVTCFLGNADILDPDELEDYNIRVPGSFIEDYMDEQEVSETYLITTLQGGQKKPKMVQARTPDGSIVTLPESSGPKRRVRVRQ